MKLNKFTEEVHQNAVEHGWWDEERSFGDIISLCHSELSEALEEFRAKRGMVWYTCTAGNGGGQPCNPDKWLDCKNEADCTYRSDKPEGIAVELADCVIRILDWFGKEELDTDALILQARTTIMCDVPCRVYAASLGDCIARWHLLLSLAYSCWCRASGSHAAALRMARCVAEIAEWAEAKGVDLEGILDIKHAYNKTRPYRHGGKALRCPETFFERENDGKSPKRPIKGVVVYVHPQGRYHTVEFDLLGGKVRESFMGVDD